jgi:hypothetical protein
VLAIERASRAATEPVGTLISTAPPKYFSLYISSLTSRRVKSIETFEPSYS